MHFIFDSLGKPDQSLFRSIRARNRDGMEAPGSGNRRSRRLHCVSKNPANFSALEKSQRQQYDACMEQKQRRAFRIIPVILDGYDVVSLPVGV